MEDSILPIFGEKPLLIKNPKNTKRRCRQFQSWWVQILEHPSQIPSLGLSEDGPGELFWWWKLEAGRFGIWNMAGEWTCVLYVFPTVFSLFFPPVDYFGGICWYGMAMVKFQVLEDFCWVVTLPETNIAPKNGWMEYYFPIGEAYF